MPLNEMAWKGKEQIIIAISSAAVFGVRAVPLFVKKYIFILRLGFRYFSCLHLGSLRDYVEGPVLCRVLIVFGY